MSLRVSQLVRLLLLLALGIGLTGCRSKDPLDWKVEGRNAIRLQEWLLETEAALPRALQQEFAWAFNNLATTTPNWRDQDPRSTRNPLCLRVQGLTIREILIDGYERSSRSLLSRIGNDQDNVRRLVENYATLESSRREEHHYQAQLAFLQKRIAESRHERERVNRRIDELRGSRNTTAAAGKP